MLPTDINFTIFDVETTGLSPASGDRIIEIAGMRMEGGKINEEKNFTSFVNPERSIPWEAQRVNKITEDDLHRAPLIAEVLPKFLEFAQDSILIAHNAGFDMGFLEAEKELCWGYIDIPECFCTLKLSRALFPHEYRHKLGIVSERLGLTLPEACHRALPDVLLTSGIFLKLVEIGGITTLDELRVKAGLRQMAV